MLQMPNHVGNMAHAGNLGLKDPFSMVGFVIEGGDGVDRLWGLGWGRHCAEQEELRVPLSVANTYTIFNLHN